MQVKIITKRVRCREGSRYRVTRVGQLSRGGMHLSASRETIELRTFLCVSVNFLQSFARSRSMVPHRSSSSIRSPKPTDGSPDPRCLRLGTFLISLNARLFILFRLIVPHSSSVPVRRLLFLLCVHRTFLVLISPELRELPELRT